MKLPFRRPKGTTSEATVAGPIGQPSGLLTWSPTQLVRFASAWFEPQAIYLAQPNVRTVVSFLARNVAQLGLHVFRRVSDTNRERLTDHPLAQTIRHPNPYTTRYRLIDSLVHDIAIFDNAYWAKVRQGNDLSLVRIPPQTVSVVGKGPFRADAYRLTGAQGVREIPAETVVHFRGYNPEDPRLGVSPMRTLQSILLEDQAASDYREHFWRNAARMEGVLSRPAEAPEWGAPARQRFREEWEALYAGTAGSGKTAILEEGMTFTPTGFSAKDAEYIAARKLTREEVAAAYHVSPAMVGILEHANFANIDMQHQMLYQDTLGPWLSMIEEEIELQLVPEFAEFADVEHVYVEFNLAEKLKGSFSEEASALQTATGAPWMTRAEARARANLPPVDGADELVVPLNVLIGGQASPSDSAPSRTQSRGLQLVGGKAVVSRETHVRKHEQVLRRHFARQRAAVVSQLGAGKPLDDAYDTARWDRELHTDLLALAINVTGDVGRETAAKVDGNFDVDRTLGWLDENARHAAETINATLRSRLAAAVGKRRKAAGDDEEDDPATLADDIFDIYVGSESRQISQTRVTAIAGFAFHESAEQNGIREKQWIVTSRNSRHPRLNGERVPLGDNFSNGLRWPGDGSTGDVNEVAGCTCALDL